MIEALRALSQKAPTLEQPYLVRSIAIPAVSTERLLQWTGSERLVWGPPDLGRERAWSVVGLGATKTIESHGEQRWEVSKRETTAFFSALGQEFLGQVEAPAPRLYGGFRFHTETPSSALWRGFSDGSLVMPRWHYAVKDQQACLSLCLSREEWKNGGAQSELETIASLLTESALSVARTSASTEETAEDEQGEWEQQVNEILRLIEEGALEKVVLARAKRLAIGALQYPPLVHALSKFEGATRFLFEREGAVFLGATPEVLASVRNGRLYCDALAGSIARSLDETKAVEQRKRLLEDPKELAEHALVVEGIVETIGTLTERIERSIRPRVRSLQHVQHLWTPIEATLRSQLGILDVVARLHPTPAVCGTPKKNAMDWILQHETCDRGWYAGPVGYVEPNGDGTFVVALRSALLCGREAHLFAGAGIVKGSKPTQEFVETKLKQQTMLSVLTSR